MATEDQKGKRHSITSKEKLDKVLILFNYEARDKFIKRCTEVKNSIKQGEYRDYRHSGTFNKVSQGYCAQIADMTKEEFIRYLGENGVPIFQYDDEQESIEEMNNA